MDTECSAKKGTITRRNFVKVIVGVALAAFSASTLGVVLRFLWPAIGDVDDWPVRITEASEIPINSVKERWTVTAKKFPALLIHDEDGFRAFALKCTHLGCTAQWREQYSGYEGPVIFCPCHDGVFDPKTAEVLAGPPPSALPEIRVEEKSGTIYATGWKDSAYVKTLEVY